LDLDEPHARFEQSPANQHVPAELVGAVALHVLCRNRRRIEDRLVLLQLGGHVEYETVGLGPLLVALLGIALVEKIAQIIADGVIVGAEVGRANETLRRLAVAQRQSAVLGAEEAGVLIDEAAAIGLDPDIRRQAALGRAKDLGDGGTEVGIGDAAIFRIAALDASDAGGVRVVLGTHAADKGEMVHQLGGLWPQFADVQSRHAGRNGAKWPAELCIRLGVPTFELAGAAVEPDEEDLLLLLLHLLGDGWRGQAQASRSRRDAPQPLSSRQAMFPGIA